MPGVQMSDLAAHIHANPSPRASMDAVLEAVISRFSSVNNASERDEAIADLQAHRSILIENAFANAGTASSRATDPSLTASAIANDASNALDPAERSLRAESLGNPALPRDASGHKVHPADALSFDGSRVPGDRTASSLAADGRAREFRGPHVPADSAMAGSAGSDRRAEDVNAQERYRLAAEQGLAKQRATAEQNADNGPAV